MKTLILILVCLGILIGVVKLIKFTWMNFFKVLPLFVFVIMCMWRMQILEEQGTQIKTECPVCEKEMSLCKGHMVTHVDDFVEWINKDVRK